MTVDHSHRAPHGTFGNAVRRLRKERGWTQVQLAEKLNRTQSTVAHIESGRIGPSVLTVKRMAVAFNVPLEYLLAHRRSLF